MLFSAMSSISLDSHLFNDDHPDSQPSDILPRAINSITLLSPHRLCWTNLSRRQSEKSLLLEYHGCKQSACHVKTRGKVEELSACRRLF